MNTKMRLSAWFLTPHLLSHVLALPSPQIPDLVSLAVQPNNGGGKSDDCGSGPVQLNLDTWNAFDMDNHTQTIWDRGVADPNFDFHQAYANIYGVDLHCANTFTNCEGDPVSCSDLQGSAHDKTQGWLGIKSMMAVQQTYLQNEKILSQVGDNMFTALGDFQHAIGDVAIENEARARAQAGRKLLYNSIGGAVSMGFAYLAIAGTAIAGITFPPVGLALGAIVAPIIATYQSDAMDDQQNIDNSAPDWTITDMFDQWGNLKQQMLQAVDMEHSAVFSNGKVESFDGPKIVDLMKGGRYAGTMAPSAYDAAEGNIRSLLERVLFTKLMEANWKNSFNAFYVYLPGIIDNCHSWHGNTGANDQMRYCADKGMYIMMGIDPDSGVMQSPRGAGTDEVQGYGNFDIQLADLHRSNALTYEGHGLVHSGLPYFYDTIIKTWQANPDKSIHAQPGMFYLPVCNLKPENWWQSDVASQTLPPCDCLTAADPYGSKFIDQATDTVRNWIQASCN